MTEDRRKRPLQRKLPKQHHDRMLPFQPGNTLSIVHGIYSERTRSPIEERMADALRQSMAEGLGRSYNPALDEHAIRRCARFLTTVEMVEAFIDREGPDSLSDGVKEHYKTAVNHSTKLMGELGLTPKARASLGVDVARTYDLVAALEHRRQQREDATEDLCDECERQPPRYRLKKRGLHICADCARDLGYLS